MDSEAFAFVCEALETQTSFDRLEARGTVRIMLKQAGLEPRTVTPEQMSVAVAKLLPSELESRAVSDSESLCKSLQDQLVVLEVSASTNTPEHVFERLGG